ncbi:MAG: hypothetical protein KBB37_02795 [Bacteroidia bacterium]|nr:hypothetical protein [Bacteroidia bacterium]MBP7260190.1 hypothetical protein [Bacteroidia bacterium]MBP9181079.1 hypothetical protein [Bacteroidia bacterium]MBP9723844.1 hypothetical protein [Bacteroidia bacterium]
MKQEEKIQEYIDKESTRFATANIYRLDNIYLTHQQKIEVEHWYQLPMKIMFVTLCICMLYSTYDALALKWIIGIPIILDLMIGLLNWSINIKKVYTTFFLTIGNNFVLWGLTLVTMGFLIYNGKYFYAVLVLIGQFGLISILSPSLYVYTILSKKYKMHPKWVFFKRFYSMYFPFEKEIEQPN